ncbi:MAG: hypothetical protein IKX24_01200 [Prevotella sp.]|nr:hypothetical protein [Prevotella sp.]
MMKNDKKNKKSLKEQKKREPKTIKDSSLRLLSVLLSIFALLALWFVMITYEKTLLFRVQEFNLFLYTPLFFKQCMVASGGFLAWLSMYFTQYFYHPWIGATLLCLWWALLMWLTKKAFNIPNKWAVVLVIPIALLAIADFQIGYWLFYLKLRGYYFIATIGMTVVMALIWTYRNLPTKTLFYTLFIIISTIVTYPLFGFYGLLATLGMAIITWKLEGMTIGQRSIATVVALLAIIAVPLVYYRYVYHETNIANIYWTALPLFRIDKDYYAYYIPFYLLSAFVVIAALLYKKQRQTSVKRVILWAVIQVLALAAIVLATYHFWYKDKNFHTELEINRCVENVDWDGVLDIARDWEDPTRMMWMMKNLALFREGRQGDEMYRYKNGDKRCEAPFMVRLTQTGGKLLYLHYGQTNFCYRWCLEDGVEYGWRIEYYKFMLKCSLLNNEMVVAQKYIDILKKTKYYAKWAEQYEPYTKNAELIKKDKELGPILPMLSQKDLLTSDNTLIEIYLLNTFSNDDSDNPIYQEQTLLAALQVKDIGMFWPRFFHYATIHQGKPMPKHYQEAAYLYGHLENKIDISQMPFDKDVVDTYNDFMAAAQSYSGMTEEQMKPYMYDRFGGTFYFEYFFTRNQKSY